MVTWPSYYLLSGIEEKVKVLNPHVQRKIKELRMKNKGRSCCNFSPNRGSIKYEPVIPDTLEWLIMLLEMTSIAAELYQSTSIAAAP